MRGFFFLIMTIWICFHFLIQLNCIATDLLPGDQEKLLKVLTVRYQRITFVLQALKFPRVVVLNTIFGSCETCRLRSLTK